MAITVSSAYKDGLRGPVDISKPRVQINFYGALWVHVTDLVEGSIRGRMEESPVGGNFSSNYCFVTFNNDDGRFSPLNTGSDLYGYLTPNKPIVIDVLVNGEACRVFTGVTSAFPPHARARTITIKCYDKARIFAKMDIVEELVYNEANPGTGLSWNRVFERAGWLAGLRWDYVQTYDTSGTYAATSQLNPDGSTTAITVASGATTTATYRQGGAGGTIVMKVDIARSAAGAVLMLKATNVSGKVLKVLSDLAMVVDGRIYFDQQGILRVRSRMYVADPAFTETITIDDLDDCQFTQNYEGSAYPLYNAAKIQAKPLSFRVDSTLALVEEPVSFLGDKFPYREFSGGQTFPSATDGQQFASLPDGIFILKSTGYPTADKFSIKSALKDDLLNDLGSNGIVWAADYPKFGTNRVELKLTNNNAKTAVLTELTLNAKLAAPRVVITAKHKDQTSIDQYGQTDFNYQNDFIPDNLAAENLCSWVIASCKDVKPVITLPMTYATPWTELGDCWRVSETTASIIPTPTDMVIRAFDWVLGKEAYTITPEVVPPAPAFVLQTATGSIQETSNAAAGAKGDEVPFGAVAAVGKQVGLNAVSAFTEVLGSTRYQAVSGYGNQMAMAYYGGYVWSVTDFGYVLQHDAITLALVGSWQLPFPGNGIFYAAAVNPATGYLFIGGSSDSGGACVLWFNLNSPGTTKGTNWDVKVDLSTQTPQMRWVKKLVRDGSYLYALGQKNEAGNDGDVVLARLDAATYNSATVQDIRALTTTGVTNGTILLAGATRDKNGKLWVGVKDRRTSITTGADVNIGDTIWTLSSTAGLAVGQGIQLYKIVSFTPVVSTSIIKRIVSGTQVEVEYPAVNSYVSGDTVLVGKGMLVQYDPVTPGVVNTTTFNGGYLPSSVEWDGQFLWCMAGLRLTKFDVTSGAPVELASINFKIAPADLLNSQGGLRFDGTYLWCSGSASEYSTAGNAFQVDPRQVQVTGTFAMSRIASFYDSLFDGRSMLCCGPGYIISIPRFTSQAI